MDFELLCHTAPLSLYLPLSLPLSQDVRGSGLLKRREANLSRAGTFFFFFSFSFSFFFFLIDRMIILSFEQINEHSRAASPIHSSSRRGCCRHDTNKKKNYPRLANEPLVRSNFCGTGFFIVNHATFLEFGATGFLQFIGFPLRLNILDRDIEIVFFFFSAPFFDFISSLISSFSLSFSYFRSCLSHSLHQLATFRRCKM